MELNYCLNVVSNEKIISLFISSIFSICRENKYFNILIFSFKSIQISNHKSNRRDGGARCCLILSLGFSLHGVPPTAKNMPLCQLDPLSQTTGKMFDTNDLEHKI